MRDERYNAQQVEEKWAARWQQDPCLYAAEENSDQAEILRAGDVAVSFGSAAHGARAELLHWRRARPLHVDERLQRAASHGMGFVRIAGGERRYFRQNSAARVDASQHCQHEGADEAPGFRLRLGARGHHLPARILPLEPVVLSEALRAGPGVSQKEQSELVPEVRTVLANEQVINGGCCWRHEDTLVEQRELEQWFVRMTKYADELLRDLDVARLAGKSPHHAAQLDWAQRRHAGGLQAGFDRKRRRDHRLHHARGYHLRRYFGAACARASDHEDVGCCRSGVARQSRTAYRRAAQGQRSAATSARSKSTACITGRFAINPFNSEKVPIWVANYILMDYGTGAIMCVPAHDERDYEFAKKYGIEIRQVILPTTAKLRRPADRNRTPFHYARWHARSTPANLPG